MLSVHVDVSQAEKALPFFALSPSAHLRVTFEDAGAPSKDPEKEERNKVIAQIHMHAEKIGYSEDARRAAYRNLTTHDTLVEMNLDQLKTVEREFRHELNPVGPPP